MLEVCSAERNRKLFSESFRFVWLGFRKRKFYCSVWNSSDVGPRITPRLKTSAPDHPLPPGSSRNVTITEENGRRVFFGGRERKYDEGGSRKLETFFVSSGHVQWKLGNFPLSKRLERDHQGLQDSSDVKITLTFDTLLKSIVTADLPKQCSDPTLLVQPTPYPRSPSGFSPLTPCTPSSSGPDAYVTLPSVRSLELWQRSPLQTGDWVWLRAWWQM